jgi:hypothetical protein
MRPNKNNSWFQVSQPCFIWVGTSEKHFIKKNILSQSAMLDFLHQVQACHTNASRRIFVFSAVAAMSE